MSSQAPPPPPPPPPPPGGGTPPGGMPPGGFPPPGGMPPGAMPPGSVPPGGSQSGGYPMYGAQPGPVRGHRGGRMGRGILIGVFAGILAVVLVITGIVVTQSAPPPPKSDCPVPPCGPPPKPTPKGSPGSPPLVPALHNFTPFESRAGYQLEFNPNLWSITDQNDNDVALELSINGISAVVQIRSVRFSGDANADASAVSERVDALGKDVLGLARDRKNADQILEPAVGYRSGAGFAFSGVADTPQGPGSPVAVVITAAHDDQILVTFTLIADEANKKAAFFLTDSLMNTFRFPSEVKE